MASPRKATYAGAASRNALPVNRRDLFAAYGDVYVNGLYEINAGQTTISNDSGILHVATLTDFRTGYGGRQAVQGDVNLRPVWLPTSGPQGRATARFENGGGDDSLALPAASTPSGSFWRAALFLAPANQNAVLVGTDGAVAGRNQLRILNTGVLVHNVGTNGDEATPNVTFPLNNWCLAIGSWDATAKRSRVELISNGIRRRDSAVRSTAVVGSTALGVGTAGNQLLIPLVMTGGVDLLGSADPDVRRLRRDVVNYVAERYGLAF